MRILLGVFVVLSVSGDDETTITGVLEGSVLLSCTCSQRNLNKDFKWQREDPGWILLRVENETTHFSNGYKGRAKIFLPENSSNCSVLLTNITLDDHGKYSCRFFSQGTYKKSFVNLNVSVSYNICQEGPVNNLNGGLNETVYHCVAKGPYQEAEIQWKLDGQLLENTTSTHVTHTKTLDAPTGHYLFSSNIKTKLQWTQSPTCDVKARGASTVIRSDCLMLTERLKTNGTNGTNGTNDTKYHYMSIIPILLVLGLSLVLWKRWKSSQHREEVDGIGDKFLLPNIRSDLQ